MNDEQRAPEEGPGRFSRGRVGLVAGPLVFAAMLLSSPPSGMRGVGWHTAAMGVLMAVWWVTEAMPIAATALVPLAALPLLGVSSVEEAAAPYANPIIFLFLGGFVLAAALQRSGLHRRIALSIVSRVGTGPRNLVGGFMLATALLSMWVSNTATVAMMYPIALSVILMSEDGSEAENRRFAVALLLGTAYAASLGGLGTLIGTPPNALLAGFMAENYGFHISFVQWMLVGVPLVVVSLPLCWFLLVRVLHPLPNRGSAERRELIREQIRNLGAISRREAMVASIAVLVALAWMFRPLLAKVVPGLSDAGIAMIGSLLLFLIPVDWRKLHFSLQWSDVEALPWGVLILFGGGLSLAKAIQSTGLAEWIGTGMERLGGMPIVVVAIAVTTVVIFLTELTSNTATAAAFLPVVASLATGIGSHPFVLATGAALAASCAFMMPVATPPNAIVYASGHLTIPEMAKTGLWLNLLMIVLINLAVFLLAIPVFGI